MATTAGHCAVTHQAATCIQPKVLVILPPIEGISEQSAIADVEAIESGLYLYARNDAHLPRLKHLSRDDFIWEEVEPDLYLLETGNFKNQAKFISCSQDIAGDSAFSLGMLCDFEPQLDVLGLSSREFQVLYHFTIGRAITDLRLTTLQPYNKI